MTWNVGGVACRKIYDFLNSTPPEKDVFCFQEMPRKEPGWEKPRELGQYVLRWYQGLDGWRGQGVAFCSSKFTAKRKKATEHGIWLLLEMNETGQSFGVGSCYLSAGIPQLDYELQHAALLRGLPASDFPTLAGGDWNVAFGWMNGDEEPIAASSSGKLRGLKNAMQGRRLQVNPQSDPEAFTHWSRKRNGTGGQIDAWWTNMPGRCCHGLVRVGSKDILGTDHDQVVVDY